MAFAYFRTLVTAFLSPAKEAKAPIPAVEAVPGEGLTERQCGDSGAHLQSNLEIPPLSLVGDYSVQKPDPAVYEFCRRRYALADVVYIDDRQVENSDRRMRHRSRRSKSKERDIEIDAARRAKRESRGFA